MAIHDLHYATPPADFGALCARLQLLSEMRVGTRVRQAEAEEDAAYRAAKSKVT